MLQWENSWKKLKIGEESGKWGVLEKNLKQREKWKKISFLYLVDQMEIVRHSSSLKFYYCRR